MHVGDGMTHCKTDCAECQYKYCHLQNIVLYWIMANTKDKLQVTAIDADLHRRGVLVGRN